MVGFQRHFSRANGTDRLVGTIRADLRNGESVKRILRMDKEIIEMLARRAGLAKALKEFPEDVAAAATQANDVASKINDLQDVRAEPWPPMRAGEGL
jgi:hypothetical protein